MAPLVAFDSLHFLIMPKLKSRPQNAFIGKNAQLKKKAVCDNMTSDGFFWQFCPLGRR